MFFIFIRACKKYKFVFSLSALNGLTMTLHPVDNFSSIIIKQEYYERNFNGLFSRAIKEMKMYRKNEVIDDLS